MSPDDLREETKRGIDSLLDLVLDAQSKCETPMFSRSEAFQLIHAALRGCSVSADSTLAAYATTMILGTLGLKFWTFDEYEAQVCRRAIRPSSLTGDEV
jgi:hypothetical protein